MTAPNLNLCAAALGEARLAAAAVPEFSAADAPATTEQGYETQRLLHLYLSEKTGGARAGWKVGATTENMQRYLGVDGPAYGRILSTGVYEDGAALSASEFCNPGIECEIAVRISGDTDGRTYDRSSIAAFIDGVLPAIEIVENRYGDFLKRGAPTLIADDFFHKACVAGTVRGDWKNLDLARIAGRTLVQDVEKGAGTGVDVMGHPLEAVAWLANILSEHSQSLRAGDIVLTGSVAPVIWLDDRPQECRIELDGLGAVSVTLF